jgi:hypothetical protein
MRIRSFSIQMPSAPAPPWKGSPELTIEKLVVLLAMFSASVAGGLERIIGGL